MLSVDIDLLWTVINVVLLFILVRVFLFKPIHKILDERQALVDKELEEARTAHAEADALVAEQENFKQNMAAEKAKAIDESTKKAMEVYDEIVANANKEAAQIIKNAETEGELQKKEILRETQSEIRELVLAATARVVGVQTGSDSALYDQFLEKAGDTDDKSNV